MSHAPRLALAATLALVLVACDSPDGGGTVADATDTVLGGADTTPLFDTSAPADTACNPATGSCDLAVRRHAVPRRRPLRRHRDLPGGASTPLGAR